LNRLGFDTSVVAWAPTGSLEKQIKKAGITTYTLESHWRFSPFAAQRLLKLLKREHFNIVHAHLFPLHWWIACLPLSPDLGIVYSEHSISNRRRAHPFLRPIERYAYRNCDAVVAVSPKVLASLQRWQEGLDNVICINNGVPPLREEAPYPSEPDNRLLFVGRLVPAKGADILIHACLLIRQRGIAFHLDIVGEGPERTGLENLTRSLDLSQSITFHGLSNDPTPYFLKRPIVIQPSRREGLPLVTLEAMRAQCPIIATRVGGLPEVLDDGTSALLVEPENPIELASAVQRLLQNRQIADTLSIKAHKAFLETFNIDKSAAAHAALYEDIHRKRRGC
jgi:glycosyltransferase involved in cell wall biosynthesis